MTPKALALKAATSGFIFSPLEMQVWMRRRIYARRKAAKRKQKREQLKNA